MDGAGGVRALPLGAICDVDRPRVGAKAATLAALARQGFPVPPGFCIAADAYRAHVAPLGERIAAVAGAGEEERTRRLEELRQAIVAAPLDAETARAIETGCERLGAAFGSDAPACAVRSSGTCEDLAAHSFAGQHESFLGVRGPGECIEAVKKVWASLWSERAAAYRARSGIAPGAAAMAVIVQRLVPAEWAGVAFTADPVTGARDRTVIECAAGLGAEVAAGTRVPDRFVVARESLRVLERREAPRGEGDARAADDALLGRVSALASAIEAACAVPQDIEWAAAGGRVHVLQARPITALPRPATREERQVWTNANTGEVLPDVVTPMSWSVIEPAMVRLFEALFGSVDLSRAAPLFTRIAGRVYFNLNTFTACLRAIPVLRHRDFGELFGGGQAEALRGVEIPPEDIPDVRLSLGGALARLPVAAVTLLTHLPSRGYGCLERMARANRRLRRCEPAALSDGELIGRIRATAGGMFIERDLFFFIGTGPLYMTLLFNLCGRVLGPRGEADARHLLAGLGGLDDADAGHALWRLALAARAHRAIEAALLDAPAFEEFRARIAGAEGAFGFLCAWDDFMRAHGHHTRGELELANERWSETPDYVLGLVRDCVRGIGTQDPLARWRAAAAARAAALARLRRSFRSPIDRALFELAFRQAQHGVRLRENGKSLVVERVALLRRLLCELGARLAARGILASRDDIFFLRREEVEDCAACGNTFRDLVARRRAEYERDIGLSPPPVVRGVYDPARHRDERAAPRGAVLRGTAVSPGSATGRARVIRRAERGRVLPGEILVVPFADPGWAPYFLNAAAVVMDMGGVLSHGCIIAREYGLPAVVNVGPATAAIATGQLVRVDGDAGTVTILEPAAGE
ncbi:MAG TPA: hypothetical protein DCM87_09365 [Planctomycetes bacterium]|nr:hypothetical protein [Planctomycetota bacterium]